MSSISSHPSACELWVSELGEGALNKPTPALAVAAIPHLQSQTLSPFVLAFLHLQSEPYQAFSSVWALPGVQFSTMLWWLSDPALWHCLERPSYVEGGPTGVDFAHPRSNLELNPSKCKNPTDPRMMSCFTCYAVPNLVGINMRLIYGPQVVMFPLCRHFCMYKHRKTWSTWPPLQDVCTLDHPPTACVICGVHINACLLMPPQETILNRGLKSLFKQPSGLSVHKKLSCSKSD